MHATTSVLYERIETNHEKRVEKNSNQKKKSQINLCHFPAKMFAFHSQTNFDQINNRYVM